MRFRENAGRIVETMPKPGRIAMYTSGCPKNQKRCCQSRGEPPEWGRRWSLTTSPAGLKKLVPATLSRIMRMQAGSNTENARRPMIEVMNQAHVESGMRASDIPFVRKSRVVVMKFKEPNNCPMQKMAMERAQ